MIPMMINNIASGHISMHFGLRGPNFAIVSACATATHSIGEGWRLIRESEADLIIAGGSEAAVVGLGLSGFGAMKALSTRNEEPTRASRPFDKGRDGFVLSEGSGVIILEEYEHAKKRSARIYGEILGYGATADAYHLTAPAPEGAGAARAMRIALQHAKLNPEQVDYINAHGTSTPQGDQSWVPMRKKWPSARRNPASAIYSVQQVPLKWPSASKLSKPIYFPQPSIWKNLILNVIWITSP
jgi:3-oxoacyl-[acyl-carrier-protein] synthase II